MEISIPVTFEKLDFQQPWKHSCMHLETSGKFAPLEITENLDLALEASRLEFTRGKCLLWVGESVE